MNHFSPKPKVIIFSSLGGGGHVAAAEALREALFDSYDVEIYNALSDVFNKVDLFSKVTRKKMTGEDFYNFVLKKRFFAIANMYAIVGGPYMKFNQPILAKAACEFLSDKKPDIVISVIPFFNGALSEACKDLKIPFWIIPTDVELKTFFVGLNSESIFNLGLAYKPQELQALDWGVCASQITKIGFPVKKACVKQYDEQDVLKLKDELRLSQYSKLITLTLGAAGTSLFYKLMKVLLKVSPQNLEFNACAGRDRRSFKKARRLLDHIATCEYSEEGRRIYRLKNGNRLHLWGFTKKLPELMATSDLIIAKSGSLSVSEALHLNKYVLLDHTLNSSSRFLHWERVNLPFVRSINKGDGFYSKKDLLEKIEAYLSSPRAELEEDFLNIHQTLPEAIKLQEA
jgi:UDP-N-acetylglucosamine:LPS N-acetylglucosamine transferase